MSGLMNHPALFILALLGWAVVTATFAIGAIERRYRPLTRVVCGVVAIAMVTTATVLLVRVHDGAATRCDHAGGVLVDAKGGPSVCIDRHAIIPDRKWRR